MADQTNDDEGNPAGAIGAAVILMLLMLLLCGIAGYVLSQLI
ncbi:MAG: hypothetical protein WCF84_06645 [Anaerolineae bacterium]